MGSFFRSPYVALVFFVCGVLLLIGWLYSREGIFRLSQIEFEGLGFEKKKFYEQLLLESYGESLFSLDLQKIKNVLFSQPLVAAVTLRRVWPDKLQIVIEESPRVALYQESGETFLLDAACRKLTVLSSPEDLPLLRTRSLEGARPACVFFGEVLKSGFVLQGPFREFFDEAAWASERGLELRSRESGLWVRMGSSPSLRSWHRAVFAIRYLAEKGIQIRGVDVSYQSRVVYELEQASSKNSNSPRKLQILKNELTLKELERRTGVKEDVVADPQLPVGAR